jgi:cobalt-zinc-cadmium efflux system outer membrane protein
MLRGLLLCLIVGTTAASASAQAFVVPARLSLEDALRLARDRNPGLAAARDSLAIAQADRLTALARPNPALTLESGNYPLFSPARPSFSDNQELTIRVDQEVETAGRRRLRRDAADSGVAAATARLRDDERRLDLEVRRAYFGVVLARADAQVAQVALEEIDQVIALNRARLEQGEISGGEVRRVQVERLRFVDDLFSAQLGLRNARTVLLSLFNAPDLGIDFDVTDALAPAAGLVTPQVTAPPVFDLPSLRAQALAQRPDLLAARQDVERASTETRLQRALRTPNLTLGGGYRRDFGSNAVVVGITFPLPLSDRNRGGIARASAERHQAEHVAAATATTVLLEVQQAVNATEVSRARVQYIEREYLAPARESRDIVLAAYRLGTADLIDYLDAQRAFRDTLRTYNRALYDQRLSLFQLASATAGSALQVIP